MKTTLKVMGGAALCAALAFPQTSRANLLINGGLEVTSTQLAATPAMMYADGMIHASYATNSTALTGWTLGGACIDVIPTTYWQSTQGSYSVDLAGTSGIGSISQNVSGLTPGTHYQLTFDFAINPEAMSGEVGSTKILQVTASNTDLSPTLFTGTAGTRTKSNMQYITETLDFTASSSSTTLTLAALMPTGLPGSFTPSTVFCGPVIDNLDLEPLGANPNTPPATPEPASLSLLGVSGILLLRRKTSR